MDEITPSAPVPGDQTWRRPEGERLGAIMLAVIAPGVSILVANSVHWNGATWSRATSPDTGYTFLNGIAVAPDATAWAVGGSRSQYCHSTAEADHTLLLHWNKATWSISP